MSDNSNEQDSESTDAQEHEHDRQHITVSPNITVSSSADRWFRILGTLAVSGGVVALAYALASYGLLEIGATAGTMFFFQWARLCLTSGVIKIPAPTKQVNANNEKTSYLMEVLYAGYAAYQEKIAQSKAFRLSLVAFGFTVGFMICRWLLGLALGLVSNLWVAVGIGAIIGGIFIAPEMIKSTWEKLKSKDDDGGDDDALV